MRTLAFAALFAAACSSSYIPQSRGRVAVVMQNGTFAYARDGRLHPHGFLGGGLRDAVRGNPQAERAADEYTDRLKLGALGMLGGLACSVGAMTYALSEVAESPAESNDDVPERALWLAAGCTVVMIVGGMYLASAEPYRWDAINIFNDAPPPAPLYPPGPPPWSARTQSLHMRD